MAGAMVLLLLGALPWESGQEDACCPEGPLLPVMSLLMGFWLCAMDTAVLVWMYELASQDVCVSVWTGSPGCDCPSTDVVVLVWAWLSQCGQAVQDVIVLVWARVSRCERAACSASIIVPLPAALSLLPR